MPRILVRTLLIVGLLVGHTAPALVGASSDEPRSEPVVTCESDPAPEANGVSIGTSVLMVRGDAAERVAADCDGTVSSR